jgi:RNA polymerase sigma-70 factor (ECF subfamily)
MSAMGEAAAVVTDAERTDEALMDALVEGDPKALDALVLRYQNDIFRFCMHYMKDVELAKELAQETFVRVYVARNRFDSARRFKPWMLCICRNLCLNELKRKKAAPMESLEQYASAARDDSGDLMPAAADHPDQGAMEKERYDLLARAIEALDEESREIVVLRFFEKMQAKDIAAVVGATEGAVRTRLHRILKGLREKFAHERDNV